MARLADIRSALMVDTSGAGFSANLVVLRDALLGALPELMVDYHLVNDRALEGEARATAKRELKRRCGRADLVVCASDALPSRLPEAPEHQVRVLLYPLRPETGEGPEGVSERPAIYTDIVVQSAYFAQHAVRRFSSSPSEAIRPLGLPAIDLLSMRARAEAARKKLYQHCPEARGRRIVGVSSSQPIDSLVDGPGAVTLSQELGEGSFVVFRAPRLGNLGDMVGSSLSASLIDSGPCFTPFELLLMSNALVTDRFGDAVYFSATGKPLFVLDADGQKGWAEPVAIQSLAQLPSKLADSDRLELTAVLRDRYVAPNLAGNAARVLESILGAGG